MTIKVIFQCDGCHEQTDPVHIPHRRFIGINGKSYGFGHWEFYNSDHVDPPKGWMRADPWTAACYCPSCWESILNSTDGEDE